MTNGIIFHPTSKMKVLKVRTRQRVKNEARQMDTGKAKIY